MSMNRPYGIALLSFAHLHQYKWAETFASHPDAFISGIWDDDRERGEAAAEIHQVPFFSDLDELLSLHSTEGAAVCSEPSRHRSLIERCCAHRKPVMCEKPLAPDLESALAIEEAVRRSGIRFYQSFPQRLIPSNLKIRELLESNAIGRIHHVRKRHGHGFGLENLRSDMPWIYDAEKEGGGAYLDEGIHETDLLNFFFGLPDSVTARLSDGDGKGTDLSGAAIYSYPNAMLAVHEAAWNWQAGGPTTEIYGEEGTIIQNHTDCASNKGRSYWPGLTVYRRETGEWEEIPCPFDFSEVHTLPPKEFVRTLRTNTEPASGIRDGIEALTMIRAAYESHKTGRHIKIR